MLLNNHSTQYLYIVFAQFKQNVSIARIFEESLKSHDIFMSQITMYHNFRLQLSHVSLFDNNKEMLTFCFARGFARVALSTTFKAYWSDVVIDVP